MVPKVGNFVKGKIVEVVQGDINGELGLTAASGNNNQKYVVKYCEQTIQKFLEESWLSNTIDYDDFETAILLHEYAHVMYTDFNELVKHSPNVIMKHLLNIFEDARIEYQFSKKYPTYSLYFEICLTVIKRSIDNKLLNNAGLNGDKIKEDLDEIFNIVRFNRCSRPIEEFESLVFCLNKNTRRGSTEDVCKACRLIYNVLNKKYNFDDKEELKDEKLIVVAPNGQGDINKLNKAKSIDGSNSDKISKESLGAGKNGGNLQKANSSENSIYNYVIANHSDVIYNTRQIFKRVLAKRILAPAFDGEINLTKQQELFLSEKLGEEGKYYNINKVAKEGADVIICRDVSGSTYGVRRQYAEVICIILAALEQLKGMRSCLIDFESESIITKQFEEKTIQCGIQERADGGTSPHLALNLIKNELTFKNKKRLCIIITDGDYSDRSTFEKIKKELEVNANIKFLELLILGNGINLEELPSKIYEFIIKELKYDLPA